VTVSGTDSTLSALVGFGSSGDGGAIRIAAPRVAVMDGGRITARSGGTGLAGNVVIEAGERLDVQDGTITTEAPAADGGRVTLRVGDRIDLLRARITTSVAGEAGNGGDIDIDPRFMVLDRSVIQANAVGGNGGNIDITVGNLIRTPDSVIEATSTLGIDGTISVSAPDEDLSRGLVALPAVYLDASGLLREGCAARRDVDTSSFTAAGRGGLPPGPDGPLPGFYALGDDAADADAASGGGIAPATGAAATAELATLVGFALTCGGVSG
jgi:hypothetical protein